MFRETGDSRCTARGANIGGTALGDSGSRARCHRHYHAARLPRFLRIGRVCCPLEYRRRIVRSSMGRRTRYPPERSSFPGIRNTYTHDRPQPTISSLRVLIMRKPNRHQVKKKGREKRGSAKVSRRGEGGWVDAGCGFYCLHGRPPWFTWRRWLVDERPPCPHGRPSRTQNQPLF